ncbi:MAG: methyltransferase domain-containing protein, partial [Myxococcota bacterium]
MGWYDVFALIYDRSLEDLYAPFRKAAADALELEPGLRVLDAPSGTGQSLPLLVSAVGPTGEVVALDASRGMLERARRRAVREGWTQVSLRYGRVPEALPEASRGMPFDAVLCALGLSALPRDAFELGPKRVKGVSR